MQELSLLKPFPLKNMLKLTAPCSFVSEMTWVGNQKDGRIAMRFPQISLLFLVWMRCVMYSRYVSITAVAGRIHVLILWHEDVLTMPINVHPPHPRTRQIFPGPRYYHCACTICLVRRLLPICKTNSYVNFILNRLYLQNVFL